MMSIEQQLFESSHWNVNCFLFPQIAVQPETNVRCMSMNCMLNIFYAMIYVVEDSYIYYTQPLFWWFGDCFGEQASLSDNKGSN